MDRTRFSGMIAVVMLGALGCEPGPSIWADAGIGECTDDPECDDGDPCNGAEACRSGACGASEPATDGTPCSIGTCIAGECAPRSCTMDDECDDANACNGAERCGGGELCVGSPPLDCDDGNPCTADGCDPATGCVHGGVDVDGDGYAPMTLGACGRDCDDTDATRSPDAVEVCNGIDDDCDGRSDEGLTTTWYADCDRDGVAGARSINLASCARPAPPASCPTGSWTQTAPTSATSTDCNDDNGDVSPAQTLFFAEAISGVPREIDFDYDCNGREEQSAPSRGSCTSVGVGCSTEQGWTAGAEVPACGESGSWITRCEVDSVLGCAPVIDTRRQACR